MAARQRAAMHPLDAALARLQTMAARGVQPTRMAREVEIIVGDGWVRRMRIRLSVTRRGA